MRLAILYIGQEKQAIETVALRLGYSSLAAFSRAFKRVVGQSPGYYVKPVRPQRRSDRFALQERLKPALLDRGAFGALRARHFNCQR